MPNQPPSRSGIYDTSKIPRLEELLHATDDLDALLDDPELAALLKPHTEDSVPILKEAPAPKKERKVRKPEAPKPAAPEAPAPRPEPPKKEKAKKEKPEKPESEDSPLKKALMLIAIIAIVIADLIFAFTRFQASRDPFDNRILEHVTVAGVDVGGMTQKEATAALKQVADDYSSRDMTVLLPDTTLTLSPADSHAKLNVRAAVKEAFAYGRDTDTVSGEYTLNMLPSLGISEDYIRGIVEEYAARYAGYFSPSGFNLTGEKPELDANINPGTQPCQNLNLYPGTPGLAIDVEELYRKICDAYNSHTFQVDMTALEATQEPEPLDVDAIWESLNEEPSDPHIDKETLQLVHGRYGYTFDKEDAKVKLAETAPGDTVVIPMTYVAPVLAEEDAWYQDILGYAITPHGNNEKRTENLRKACGILNGLVIQPGQTISYNEILGERTKENGWLAAPAYSGTELIDSPGGGICQVSSTLYLASVFSEMEIVERTNHGYPVTYIPIGLDATVNWGLTDLKIQNSSKLPVKILAEESDDSVKIKLMGTDLRDYYIGIIYGSGDRFATATICKYNLKTNELISKEPGRRSAYLDEVTSYRGEIFSAEREQKK